MTLHSQAVIHNFPKYELDPKARVLVVPMSSRLIKVLAETSSTSEKIIFAGDMNADLTKPNQTHVKKLIDWCTGQELISIQKLLTRENTNLDHVYIRKIAATCCIDHSFCSDHAAVIIDIYRQPRKPLKIINNEIIHPPASIK